MVNDHNSQGGTRPDRQQTHLDGGRPLVGIHVPPALSRRVVPVCRLLRHVLALVGPAGPAALGIPARLAPPDVPVHLLDRLPLRGGRHRRRVPDRREGLVGQVDVPGAMVQTPADPAVAQEARAVLVAPAGPVELGPVDLGAVALVGLVGPAAGSRPASPARISRPPRRPPRRRRRQPRGDAAAP